MNQVVSLSLMAIESLRLWLNQSPPPMKYEHPSPKSSTSSFMAHPKSGACLLLERTSKDWYLLTVQADECWSAVEFRCDTEYFERGERYEPPFSSAFEDLSRECLLPAVINLLRELLAQ